MTVMEETDPDRMAVRDAAAQYIWEERRKEAQQAAQQH